MHVISTESYWAKSKRCHFYPYTGLLVSTWLLLDTVEMNMAAIGLDLFSFLRCFAFAELPWYQRKVAAVLFASPPNATYEEVKCYAVLLLDVHILSLLQYEKNKKQNINSLERTFLT